jgi:hypothetical protein
MVLWAAIFSTLWTRARNWQYPDIHGILDFMFEY